MVGPRPAGRDPPGPRRAAADDGGRSPKRLTQDPHYLATLQLADRYQQPHSHVSSWEQPDIDDAIGLQGYRAECCDNCGTHPSVWKQDLGGHPDALIAKWRHCRVCEVVERAQKAGPPIPELPGWHLVLERNPHVAARAPQLT